MEPLTTPIHGAVLADLRVIQDHRGCVMHMLRGDSVLSTGFGEVYFSETLPGVIKGWKRHLRMTQRFAVPSGRMRIAVYDDRPASPTCGQVAQFVLGRPDAYRLLVLPPLLWYAFQCLGEHPALLCNCPDLPHDPGESQQCGLDEMVLPPGQAVDWSCTPSSLSRP